ncbi:MAG: hypothetical protein ABI412_05590 [Sphingomicrobium sp.]
MKKLSVGPEPQFAIIVLLVCLPVLFGLIAILLGSIAAVIQTIADLIARPAEKPWIALLVLLWMSTLASVRECTDVESGTSPFASLFLVAIGTLIGLSASRAGQSGTANPAQTFAAYAAILFALLHIILLLARPGPKVLSLIGAALSFVFLTCMPLYIWLVDGRAGAALTILLVVAAVAFVAWIAGKRSDLIEYGRR